MTAPTQAQYDAAARALINLEQVIMTQRGIPAFFLPPPDVIESYAKMAAKQALDAAFAVKV